MALTDPEVRRLVEDELARWRAMHPDFQARYIGADHGAGTATWIVEVSRGGVGTHLRGSALRHKQEPELIRNQLRYQLYRVEADFEHY